MGEVPLGKKPKQNIDVPFGLPFGDTLIDLIIARDYIKCYIEAYYDTTMILNYCYNLVFKFTI